MRPLILAALLLSAGCERQMQQLSALTDPAEADRRGAVELAVKGSFPAILDDIAAGGGPRLTAAMDAAGVPAQDRAARTIQLEGDRAIYEANPGALALAIFTYGS